MTRLTNQLRDKIVANAQEKSGNNARIKATQEKRAAWAEDVRLESLGDQAAELDRLQKKGEALRMAVPIDFRGDHPVKTRGQLNLNCAGISVRVKEWSGFKVAPGSFTITADNPLVARFHEIIDEEKENQAAYENLDANVRGALQSVTTIPKLLKAWPEAKELLPADVDQSKPQLPALRVDALNALVGLPTEGEE